MYGIVEGEPFKVFARRESAAAGQLVIKFECNDGMGILGIRKVGRSDPAPAAAYEEEDIDPASLRAGRFVHVLSSGQRQSYALSRISPEYAERMPVDRWVELKPHTEYGFRYLVAPDEQLEPEHATASVAIPAEGPATSPTGVAEGAQAQGPAATARAVASAASTASAGPLPPPQTPLAPAIAQAALGALSKEQAVEHLKAEMNKVHVLQGRVSELEEALRKSGARERDLLDVLGKWRAQ